MLSGVTCGIKSTPCPKTVFLNYLKTAKFLYEQTTDDFMSQSIMAIWL